MKIIGAFDAKTHLSRLLDEVERGASSVALAWLLPDEESVSFSAVLRNAPQDPPVVPGLWLYEVANALSTAVRRKRFTKQQAEDALDLVSSVPVASCTISA